MVLTYKKRFMHFSASNTNEGLVLVEMTSIGRSQMQPSMRAAMSIGDTLAIFCKPCHIKGPVVRLVTVAAGLLTREWIEHRVLLKMGQGPAHVVQ